MLALLVPASFTSDLVSFGALFAMWVVCNVQLFRRYYPEVKFRVTR
jgi:hypothetical protein